MKMNFLKKSLFSAAAIMMVVNCFSCVSVSAEEANDDLAVLADASEESEDALTGDASGDAAMDNSADSSDSGEDSVDDSAGASVDDSSSIDDSTDYSDWDMELYNELIADHIYYVDQSEDEAFGLAWLWVENEDGTATLTGYQPLLYIDEEGQAENYYLLPSRVLPSEIDGHTVTGLSQIQNAPRYDDMGGLVSYSPYAQLNESNDNVYYIPATIERVGSQVFYFSTDTDISFLRYLYFQGDAPEFAEDAFYHCEEIVCYYDKDNDTWADLIGNNFGADHVTWVAVDSSELFPSESDYTGASDSSDVSDSDVSDSVSSGSASSDSTSVGSVSSASKSSAASAKASPKTGDDRNMLVWILLLVFAAGSVPVYRRLHSAR